MIQTLRDLLDLLLHIQDHLNSFTSNYGALVYGLLFLIVFCETGLVVTPFLPGDSLLFAVGAISADPNSGINVWVAGMIMLSAAILGDTVNYWIGNKFSGWAIEKFPRIIKQSHLDKTSEFYARYGGKAIIIARFVPIVRTFAPFVAGSGSMDYKKFMFYNVSGACYIFGDLPIVKNNFELVIFGIIGISIMPMVIEIIRAKLKHKKASVTSPD
jgi:membrane-associated protein